MANGEHTVGSEVPSEHAVQLFDSRESLSDAVSAFLREGLEAGDTVLAVMSRENWDATARALRRQGLDTSGPLASGRLTMLDADTTLRSFMRRGSIECSLFESSIGTLVRALSSGRRLRVYGEMVDVLAAEGDFRGALRLEALWNDLRERHPFMLFCGYSSVNFGDPRVSESLRLTCAAHSHVRTNPRDFLATFLLDESSSGPHAATS